MARYVVMKPGKDNVATATADLPVGYIAEVEGVAVPIVLQEPIPFGHKFAIAPIAAGDPVVKYGEVIGMASRAIAPGQHAHIHNIDSNRGRGDLADANS